MPKHKKHTAVVKIANVKGVCKATHGFVVAQYGDKIKFHNGTKGRVHVHISDDHLLKHPMFTILPGKDRTEPVQRVCRGIYPYAVFCEDKKRFCIGGSMPIIIVPR